LERLFECCSFTNRCSRFVLFRFVVFAFYLWNPFVSCLVSFLVFKRKRGRLAVCRFQVLLGVVDSFTFRYFPPFYRRPGLFVDKLVVKGVRPNIPSFFGVFGWVSVLTPHRRQVDWHIVYTFNLTSSQSRWALNAESAPIVSTSLLRFSFCWIPFQKKTS